MSSMNTSASSNGQDNARRAASSGARVGAGLVALGEFLLLISAAFLSPFALSPNAIQNDVYMTNLFLSPMIAALGVICAILGTLFVLLAPERRRVGHIWARALLIAACGAVLNTLAYFLFGGRYVSFGGAPISWPPYLNGVTLGLAALVGLLTLLAGWRWATNGFHRVAR